MDFNSSLDIIIKDLKEARQIIDDLKNYEGVPLFQVELAKSKCRSAEDLLELLKTVLPAKGMVLPADRKPEPKAPKSALEKIIEITEEKNAPPPPPAPVKTTAITEEKAVFSANTEEPVPDVIPEVVKTEKTAAPPQGSQGIIREVENTSEEIQLQAEERTILAERFTDQEGRLNEMIGNSRKDDDVASAIKSSPVSNLYDAIGINDRFYFIREIFSGNSTSYNSAIEKLNSVASIEDAKAVIMSYTGISSDSDAIKQLLEIVKRKLPSNG